MNIEFLRQMVRNALPLAAIAALLAVTGYRIWFAPIAARAVSPAREALPNEIFGTGTLEARVRASISPRIQGRLVSVLVDQNEFVQRDQLLAALDDGELRELVEMAAATLSASEASVARAKADQERVAAIERQARLEHERVMKLMENKIASASDLDRAVEGRSVAEAELKRSFSAVTEAERQMIAGQRNLQYQRERLKDTKILSPFDGLVVKRNRDPGDVVVPGSSILEVICTNELWVSAWVDETALSQLDRGQSARVVFRSEPRRNYAGEVARIGAETDRETREALIDVTVRELPSKWAVGQRAEVFVQSAPSFSGLTVPSEAIRWREGRPAVFVQKNGRAVWTRVELGARGPEQVEITAGLDEHDQVLVETKPGSLKEGKRVRLP